MYRRVDYRREVDAPDGQEKAWRDEFSRDYGRVIHSASFRRLQGKTQVFPSRESDFFRNRLTHSLEVAQIGQGIAERLNHDFADRLGPPGIDGRLCATAGLIHDIGHPPFGHNGEKALDKAMKPYGGFEGNAQTLRIVTRLEKKKRYKEAVDGDDRAGYNLCHRTIASALKYDKLIPAMRGEDEDIVKGYYLSENTIVDRVKASILDGYQLKQEETFKTIECSIMDLADDIAYSVYDLEDCLKVGILSPGEILSSEDKLLAKVAAKVSKELEYTVTTRDVLGVFLNLFAELADSDEDTDALPQDSEPTQESERDKLLVTFAQMYLSSKKLGEDGYRRTKLSSELVHKFISGVELTVHEECKALSSVKLPKPLALVKEVLKQYTRAAAIYSPRVKIGEYRGSDLVGDIFEALMSDKGDLLMPDDVRAIIDSASDVNIKARTVCDFVAGMTDRYAMEFWARLKSDSAESMFKPI